MIRGQPSREGIHSQAHLSNSRYSLVRGAVGVGLHDIGIQLMKKPVGLEQSPNTRRINYVKERPKHRALRNTERGRDPGRSRSPSMLAMTEKSTVILDRCENHKTYNIRIKLTKSISNLLRAGPTMLQMLQLKRA